MVRSITLIGRRWWRRSVGGTYCTCEIHVNGTMIHKVGPTHGYGDYWKQIGWETLQKLARADGSMFIDPATVEKGRHGSCMPIWRWAEENNVELTRTVSDVPRERDL
jgi:hypothetical protein